MTVDKAIELLQAIIQTGEYEGDPDDSDAIKFGVAALKGMQILRDVIKPSFSFPLNNPSLKE